MVVCPCTTGTLGSIAAGISGDLIDRGPDERPVLDLVRKLEGEAEKARGRVHVVLGNTAARRLGIDDIGVRVWLGDRWFSVIGILAPVELASELDSSAFVGIPLAEELYEFDGSPSTIYVRSDVDFIDDVRGVMGRTANPEDASEVEVTRPSDVLEAKAAAAVAFTDLFLGLGAVALIVGGFGIANVMLMSVMERRGEIGLRRALGATRRHIALQFVSEALALALVALLVAFGRMAADRELLALEASGLRALRLSRPALGFAAIMAVGSLGLSLGAAPWAHRQLDASMSRVAERQPAVVVVEQRGIEPTAVQVDRVAPFAVYRCAGSQVVVRVLEIAVVTFDVGVDQVIQAIAVTQARRPDTAGIRVAAHVQ